MSVILGVLSSFLFNVPVGPSIVVAATMMYCLALVTTKRLRRN
jgi:ABC-type Mn2+/Zn2+ transport system permease subunit